MVDEYQDTNLAQYVIVRQLSIDYPNLAVTGDPDQSIYGWRGANTKNVSYLERDYPHTKIIRLEDNYRSTPEILSVADCLIQNNEYRKPKRLVPCRESGAAVRICVYTTARREAEDIVRQIIEAVNSGERSLRDFAFSIAPMLSPDWWNRFSHATRSPTNWLVAFAFTCAKRSKT